MMVMASNSAAQATSITCKICDINVTLSPGARRTICPNCGNYYSDVAGPPRAIPTTERNGHKSSKKKDSQLPKLSKNEKDKDKTGNRLHAIADFFQNLTTPNSRRARSSGSYSDGYRSNQSSPHNTELPPIRRDGGGGKNQNHVRISQCSSPAVQNNIIQEHMAKRKKSSHEFRVNVRDAKDSGIWKDVQEFYASTFDSFQDLNNTFKRDGAECKTTDDPCVNFELLFTIYDLLSDVPQDIQKLVLKSVINSLLKDKRPHTKDDLRAYLILLQNPLFSNMATYVIFAHLLRQMAALTDHDHHFLVHWLRKLEVDRFRNLVQRLHNFISCRLFPPKPKDLPPMSKCTWWIPSATKVMALLNAANNLSNEPIISHMEFYNNTLDHLDLMAEYYAWQNPATHPGFTFCQYPFILSITAKRTILQRDSEQQMIIMARRSLVAKVQRRQLPDIGMLFLNLNVRRSHLVSDSLNEVARKQHDLKKKLKVTFSGEPGLDMGGLTKEWFLLLIRQIFQPEYGMFTYDPKARSYWFSTAPCDNYQEFNLVGVLMGLAVYNSINLDIHFPPCCYKKLLSPAVVPYNNPNATVGVTTLNIDDLKQVMPDLCHGLDELLNYEGNVEEDFCMTFQVSINEHGTIKTYSLKPNEPTPVPVTNKNRKEYISLYIDLLLNKAIYPQFQAFYHGFHSVCASNALIMLRPEEVEMLVCGSPTVDMSDLKKVTTYDGYHPNDQTIRHLWDAVSATTKELQKRFLLFCTGSDRIPIGGMKEMTFKITRVDNTDMLPMAHTCFNQLVLPAYKSKKVLKQKLFIAIQNAEGFGME
ncbi:putative E3 ubiquitin-protein ligase HECTD2 [Tubulanus polymorphus]|uniref:putative E3 ubiquitin-protein ligase HECTD2 n=1 Tax=Tubulanus polymorphus TaxID=672921 RepID=UPI003DA3ED60